MDRKRRVWKKEESGGKRGGYQSQMCTKPDSVWPRRLIGTTPPDTNATTRVPPATTAAIGRARKREAWKSTLYSAAMTVAVAVAEVRSEGRGNETGAVGNVVVL